MACTNWGWVACTIPAGITGAWSRNRDLGGDGRLSIWSLMVISPTGAAVSSSSSSATSTAASAEASEATAAGVSA